MTTEHTDMKERLAEAHEKAVNWTEQMLDILEAADRRDYDEALVLSIASDLPPDVRSRLERALATQDDDLISQVASDYKERLGHAFCESCWTGDGS